MDAALVQKRKMRSLLRDAAPLENDDAVHADERWPVLR
jgi:hypothetical protein